MHTIENILRRVVQVCEELGFRYYVTGSVASMYYGEPRYTNDVDVVVEIRSVLFKQFCAQFPEPGYSINQDGALHALLEGGYFNIIDEESFVKADIILPPDKPFENSKLSRCRREPLMPGLEPFVSSPEDVVLSKLLFYREGQSEKHIRDIRSMFDVGRVLIDLAYIDDWALRIGVKAERNVVRQLLALPPMGPPRQPLD